MSYSIPESANFDDLVEHMRQKGFRVGVTSNGVMINGDEDVVVERRAGNSIYQSPQIVPPNRSIERDVIEALLQDLRLDETYESKFWKGWWG